MKEFTPVLFPRNIYPMHFTTAEYLNQTKFHSQLPSRIDSTVTTRQKQDVVTDGYVKWVRLHSFGLITGNVLKCYTELVSCSCIEVSSISASSLQSGHVNREGMRVRNISNLGETVSESDTKVSEEPAASMKKMVDKLETDERRAIR